MKVILFGVRNIGYGFIEAPLSQAGYEVTFVDVVKSVVQELMRRGSYPLRIVSDIHNEDILIKNIRAIEADIMAIAVSANILKRSVIDYSQLSHILPYTTECIYPFKHFRFLHKSN